MKKTIITLAIALAFIAATATSFAEIKEVKIQTSAVCGMCKTRIEKSINQLDGIKNAILNVDDKIATVKYDDKTTNPNKIRKAISMAGYKADDLAADAKAYKMLPDHCKGSAVIKGKADGCGPTCKDKTTTEKAACCPKGCETTTKTTNATDAKACCPSGTVKIDGSAKLQSNCDPKGCKTACPSNKTTETAAPKVK
jgi:copper chaperone CopZ